MPLMDMKLLEFPHSHYCEKARWALDYKSLAFQPVALLPGFHMITARKYAPDTSLPILLHDDQVVQGSNEIINYLDQRFPEYSLTPSNTKQRQACLTIESDMDTRLGLTIRKILYFRLLAYPDFIRYCFTHSMPRFKQMIFSLFYPILRNKMYQSYVISAAKVEQAKREFDEVMSELATKLQTRKYLVGEQFTRADLSVASMLCWLAMPPEHPFPWRKIPDQETLDFYDDYQNHLVLEWVRNIYRDHRLNGKTSLE